jgi:hypothetical protein
MNKYSLPHQPVLQLGSNVETGKPLYLYGSDINRHRVIYGISGMGKSKFIAPLAMQLLNQDIPFAIIDPHSDLADDELSLLIQTGFFTSPKAYDRLWYVTFSDPNRFIPFNWLKQPYPPHHIAENFVEVVKRAWTGLGDSAVNMENIALSACMVLLTNKRPLTDLQKLLSDASFRQQLLAQVTDETVLDFFLTRYNAYSKAMSESTLRRAFLLTFSPPLRYALGATENLINFSHIIENKISVIFDLGGLDSQTQRFLGVLLTVGFETAMLARTSLPPAKRTPYQLFIDEWHQFLSASPESLSRMLDLTRKFGLTLSLSSQNFTQTAAMRSSLQNCLQIALRLGHDDAKAAASRFLPTIPPQTQTGSSFLAALGLDLFHNSPSMDDENWQKTDWWEMRLKHLPIAHCLIHLDGQTTEIQTLTVPPVVEEERLAHVKEIYAKRLLQPTPTQTTPPLQPEEAAPNYPVVDLTQNHKSRSTKKHAAPPPHLEPPARRWEIIEDEE